MSLHGSCLKPSNLLLMLSFLMLLGGVHAQDPSLTRRYYAAEGIRVGDLVMANAQGAIERAGFPGKLTEARYGKNVSKIIDVQPLTPQSCLISYQTQAGSYRLVAAAVDPAGKVSLGTDLIFGGSFIVLDANHAVTFNSGRGDIRLLAVDGTTLTHGPNTVQIPGSNASIAKVEPAMFAAIYRDTNWRVQLYKISGNSFAPSGTQVDPIPSYSSHSFYNVYGVNAGADRTLLTTLDGQFVVTLLSPSGQAQAGSHWHLSYFPVVSLGGDKVLAKAPGQSIFSIITGTGSSLATGNAITFSENPQIVPSASVMIDKAYYIAGRTSGWITNNSGVPAISRQGTWLVDPPSGSKTTMLKETLVLTAYPVPGSLQLGVRTLPPFGGSGTYLGIAEETAATGAPCKVTLAGSVTRQFSNLETGRMYYLGENGPTLNPTGERIVIGKAIAPNELEVWYED